MYNSECVGIPGERGKQGKPGARTFFANLNIFFLPILKYIFLQFKHLNIPRNIFAKQKIFLFFADFKIYFKMLDSAPMS